MKNILVFLLLIIFLSCKDGDEQRSDREKESKPINSIKSKISDPLFQYHFRILDSAAKNPPKDTMYNCCYNSVNFMEAHTGIVADVEGDYGGATGFKKEDLRKWHEWYNKKYKKENE